MKFKHKKGNFLFVDKLKGVYTVESEHRHDIVYIVDNTRFCIADFSGLMFCPLEEVPEMAGKFKPKFKREVLDIYEDIKDLKLMEVIYAE